MGKVKCAKCGSSYVDLKDTEYKREGTVKKYYCQSCHQYFNIETNYNSNSGDFIARFEGNGYTDKGFIEVYDNSGKIGVYQYEDYHNKYMNLKRAPRVLLEYNEFSRDYYICVTTVRPHHKNDEEGIYVHLDKFYLNDKLAKKALNNEAMRAVYSSYSKHFSVGNQKNKDLLSDIVSWLAFNTPLEQGSSTDKYGCYVATAVYGSYDCPQVWTLRRYRDYTLAETWYGRAFIHTYYAISPKLVKWFGETAWFKNMWKPKLDRMVQRLNDKGVADTPYRDRNW